MDENGLRQLQSVRSTEHRSQNAIVCSDVNSAAATNLGQNDVKEARSHIRELSYPTNASTVLHRIGWSAIIILVISLVVVMAVMGFLGFIFLGNINSQNWHTIMVKGWATRAVSISSLILRTAIHLQTGIAAAMLAALALESGGVLLPDAARVSIARQCASPSTLIAPLTRGSRWNMKYRKDIVILAAVTLLALTTLILQFCSTILLSDLRLGTLPGLTGTSTNKIDVSTWMAEFSGTVEGGWSAYNVFGYTSNFVPRLPTWLRSASSYPRFAEYAETVPPQEGVDDTGILLRAFPPYSNAEAREMVSGYTGEALVLDSRVSCQRPILNDLSFETVDNPSPKGEDDQDSIQTSRIIGSFLPSTKADRLTVPPWPVAFNCTFMIASHTRALCALAGHLNTVLVNVDNISNRAGGLTSEFANVTDPEVLAKFYENRDTIINWGIPYFVINVTSRFWSMSDHSYTRQGIRIPDIIQFSNYSTKDAISLHVEEDGIWSNILTQDGPANLSIALCYNAFDTARLKVDMFAEKNGSEPILHWTNNTGFQGHDLDLQLGNYRPGELSASSRGILNLTKKTSWIPRPEMSRLWPLAPYVQYQSIMDWNFKPYGMVGTAGNLSAVWSTSDNAVLREGFQFKAMALQTIEQRAICPDSSLGYIFESALRTSGSLARAVSTLITVLSSIAYYDALPQMEVQANATQVFFTTTLFPQSYLGFWTIFTVLSFHVVLVAFVTTMFVLYSHFTVLGSHWQSIAQVQCSEIGDGIFSNGMATDKQVKARLRAINEDSVQVAVAPAEDQDKVSLIRGDNPIRSRSFASTLSRTSSEKDGKGLSA